MSSASSSSNVSRAASPPPSVLFLSHYFWPEEMATGELVAGIAFALAEQGMPVSALAGQPAYRKPGGKLPRRMQKGSVVVRRVWSTQFDKNRAWGRVLNTATFALSTLFACLTGPKPGAILAVTNPPLLPWIACLVRLARGVPCILLIHDVYPQIAVALGKIKAGSAVDRLWRAINRWTYRSAWRIIALGECMADVVRGELPASQHEKVVVIPNWADGDAIRPLPSANHPLLMEWGLADRFVVQYSGNIGLFHEIRTIVEAAEFLPDIHFLFLGDGGQLPWLRQHAKEKDLRNVTLLPFQPKDRLPLTLTACTVSLVTLKEESTGYCVPSKLYGVLAAGKPVIAIMNRGCESARTIERHGCGVVVAPGDSRGLAGVLSDLKNNPAEVATMGQAARAAYEHHYSLAEVAARYGTLFTKFPGR